MKEIMENFMLIEAEFFSNEVWRYLFSLIGIILLIISIYLMSKGRKKSEKSAIIETLVSFITGLIGVHLAYMIVLYPKMSFFIYFLLTGFQVLIVGSFVFSLVTVIKEILWLIKSFTEKSENKDGVLGAFIRIILSIIVCALSFALFFTTY